MRVPMVRKRRQNNILKINLDDPKIHSTFRFCVELGLAELAGPGSLDPYKIMKYWELRLGYTEREAKEFEKRNNV